MTTEPAAAQPRRRAPAKKAAKPAKKPVPVAPSSLIVEYRQGATLRARTAQFVGRHVIKRGAHVGMGLGARFRPVTVHGHDTAERAAGLIPVPRGTTIEKVRLPHCDADWINAPTGSYDGPVMLYFHGGLFLAAGRRAHRRHCANLSTAVGRMPVLNVAYRLVPKVSLGELLQDGVDGYRWLLDQGFKPEKIVVAGDSAGGFMSLAVPQQAIKAGLPSPGGIVGISPMADLDHSRKESHPNLVADPLFPRNLGDFLDVYIKAGKMDPALSPVNGDLAGMPPVLMQVGSTEMLLADAEHMAEKLEAAGVPCRLQIWDRQFHDFHLAADVLPEARAAVREIAAFVNRVTSGGTP